MDTQNSLSPHSENITDYSHENQLYLSKILTSTKKVSAYLNKHDLESTYLDVPILPIEENKKIIESYTDTQIFMIMHEFIHEYFIHHFSISVARINYYLSAHPDFHEHKGLLDASIPIIAAWINDFLEDYGNTSYKFSPSFIYLGSEWDEISKKIVNELNIPTQEYYALLNKENNINVEEINKKIQEIIGMIAKFFRGFLEYFIDAYYRTVYNRSINERHYKNYLNTSLSSNSIIFMINMESFRDEEFCREFFLYGSNKVISVDTIPLISKMNSSYLSYLYEIQESGFNIVDFHHKIKELRNYSHIKNLTKNSMTLFHPDNFLNDVHYDELSEYYFYMLKIGLLNICPDENRVKEALNIFNNYCNGYIRDKIQQNSEQISYSEVDYFGYANNPLLYNAFMRNMCYILIKMLDESFENMPSSWVLESIIDQYPFDFRLTHKSVKKMSADVLRVNSEWKMLCNDLNEHHIHYII